MRLLGRVAPWRHEAPRPARVRAGPGRPDLDRAGCGLARGQPDDRRDLLGPRRFGDGRRRGAARRHGHPQERAMTQDYTRLPDPVRLEDTIAEVDARPVPDPEGGTDP